jgi:uncharacterized membrane protein YdjX (TVP38/TMEM64 family)
VRIEGGPWRTAASARPHTESWTPRRNPVTKLKIAATVLVITALLALHQLDLLDAFGDPHRLKQAILELGPWGHVAFVVSYTLLQPIGAPGTVFVVAAPLIWPWPVAFALSMIGSMTASVAGFSLARFIGRDWVAGKLPARVLKYEAALELRAFTTVVLLRFLFWMPQWLHVFFGVSKVPFWTHFWGSLVGYALPLLLVSIFGEALFILAKNAPPEFWWTLAIATIVLAVVAWFFTRRHRHRSSERDSPVT